MRNFVSFLRDDDRKKLLANARKQSYSDGECLLEQGTKNTCIYFINKGDVSVVSRVANQALEIAQLHCNDVFGEMSYVDNEPANADILAIGEVEVSVITGIILKRIVSKDPLFYGRFYKALARTLSHRLRFDDYKVSAYMNK